ncbi:MAG: HAD family phosphatase [Verrucomicrobia bacterium]|nr:HAD family phosphatase [Verrucomicrobiota bacterium]
MIFDCDGVLVDTEYLKLLAWQEALNSQGIEFSIEEHMPLVGHSAKNILLMIQENKRREIGEEVIDLRNATYRLLQTQGVPPFPIMVAFAKQLSSEDNLLLGLASSAPMEEILHNLRQIGLSDAFDLIISGADDLGDYSDAEGTNKPKPYIYMKLPNG